MNKLLEIKGIIATYGSFCPAEVNQSSPCIESNDNLTHLIEHFNSNDVEVSVYEPVHDIEVSSYCILYEDLNGTLLNEILEIAQSWENICLA